MNTAWRYLVANKDIPKDTPSFQDIDASLTARDLAELMRRKGINPLLEPKTRERKPLEVYSGAGTIFGCSGGVMEAALRTAYFALSGEELKNAKFNLVSGGTDNHLLLVDLTSKDITGKDAEQLLGARRQEV